MIKQFLISNKQLFNLYFYEFLFNGRLHYPWKELLYTFYNFVSCNLLKLPWMSLQISYTYPFSIISGIWWRHCWAGYSEWGQLQGLHLDHATAAWQSNPVDFGYRGWRRRCRWRCWWRQLNYHLKIHVKFSKKISHRKYIAAVKEETQTLLILVDQTLDKI